MVRMKLGAGVAIEVDAFTTLLVRPTSMGHSIELVAPQVALRRKRAARQEAASRARGRPASAAIAALRARIAKEIVGRAELVAWYEVTFNVNRSTARQAVRREWLKAGRAK